MRVFLLSLALCACSAPDATPVQEVAGAPATEALSTTCKGWGSLSSLVEIQTQVKALFGEHSCDETFTSFGPGQFHFYCYRDAFNGHVFTYETTITQYYGGHDWAVLVFVDGKRRFIPSFSDGLNGYGYCSPSSVGKANLLTNAWL